MKTKFIFSTETNDTEQWAELPFVPCMHEWFNLQYILKPDEIEKIKQTANRWSGIRGTVESVEYKNANDGFYVEIFIWCED